MLRSLANLESPIIIEAPLHFFNYGITYSMIMPGPGDDNIWFMRADAIGDRLVLNENFMTLNLNLLQERSWELITKLNHPEALLLDKSSQTILSHEAAIDLFDLHSFKGPDAPHEHLEPIVSATFLALGAQFLMDRPAPSAVSSPYPSRH
jgi:hypothetical protein